MEKPSRILICLLAFLGIGALGGGGALVLSPDGSLIGLPLFLLAKSPFHSFFVPGILLFVVLGIFPGLLIIALVKKPPSSLAERVNLFTDMHWSWSFAVYTAFALIIWIQLEMMFLDAISWLHTFYMFYAVLIIIACLRRSVRLTYSKPLKGP